MPDNILYFSCLQTTLASLLIAAQTNNLRIKYTRLQTSHPRQASHNRGISYIKNGTLQTLKPKSTLLISTKAMNFNTILNAYLYLVKMFVMPYFQFHKIPVVIQKFNIKIRTKRVSKWQIWTNMDDLWIYT